MALKFAFKAFLARSSFLEDIDHIVQCFDKGTKLRFRDANEAQFIKFGGARDNDADCNIRFGQLKLQGLVLLFKCFVPWVSQLSPTSRTDIATFFDPSIKCTVEAVKDIQDNSSASVKVNAYQYLLGVAYKWIHCKLYSMLSLLAGLLQATGSIKVSIKQCLLMDSRFCGLTLSQAQSDWRLVTSDLTKIGSIYGSPPAE